MKTCCYISIIALMAISSSPLHSQKSVYTFPFENSYRLPLMEYRINTDEISSTYQTWGNLFTSEITGYGNDTIEQSSYRYISDANVLDAVRFIEFYLKEQLMEPVADDPHGKVEMSIIYFHESNRFSGGSLFSILTIGLGALFGVPFATSVTDVEVKASFFDAETHAIAVHRGVGRGKKAMSIYTTSTRKAHQKAMRNALEDLNTKIMSDPLLAGDMAIK
jgi:hypothetical protein